MKNIILLFSLLMSHFGCQTPEPAKSLSVEFYLRYLADQSQYRAEAIFRTAAAHHPPVESEMTTPVLFDGKEMKKMPQSSATFKSESSGTVFANHDLIWTNPDQSVQKLSMPLPSLKDFNFNTEQLSRRQATTLTWVGEPIGENETFLLFWEHPEHGVVTMPISGATPTPVLQLPAVKIAELKPGLWQLYIVRKKGLKDTQKGVTIRALSEFYSITKTIKIID